MFVGGHKHDQSRPAAAERGEAAASICWTGSSSSTMNERQAVVGGSRVVLVAAAAAAAVVSSAVQSSPGLAAPSERAWSTGLRLRGTLTRSGPTKTTPLEPSTGLKSGTTGEVTYNSTALGGRAPCSTTLASNKVKPGRLAGVGKGAPV